MNVTWRDNYIDATNTFIGGTGGDGTGGDVIINNNSSNNNLSDYINTSNESSNVHLYIKNPNTYGDIRFANLYTLANTTRNHNVKIDYFGKLYVYHPYSLANPTVLEGWKDVESEIAGLIFGNQVNGLEIIVVQGQIAAINAELTFLEGKVTGLEPFVTAINANMEAMHYGFYSQSLYEEMVENNFNILINQIPQLTTQFRDVAFTTRVSQFTSGLFIPAAAGSVIGFFANHLDNHNLYVTYSNALHSNQNLTPEERKQLLEPSSNIIRENYISFNSNFCNMSLEQGFINSNIITTQFVPSLKSNKVLLGNITTPNSSYQMEMTGDMNANEYYRNSTSLTSLLAQKQDNMSATQPIYITTSTIGLNYDSSLTKVGNNLKVVKTATAPLKWTGNDISLDYDSTLLNNSGSLGVSIAAESKWGYTGANIYNKTMTNVGIGTDRGLTYKFNVVGESYFSSNVNIAIPKLNFITSYTGATLTLATGTNESYLQYTTNGTLVLNEPCACDLLVIGAGGNGGIGASSGGGGAGEVIYYPNFPLRNGTLNITIGTSSTTPANRISKINHSSGDQISARGGGDGGTSIFYTTSGGTVSALTAISGTSDAYILITAGTTLTLNASCSTDIFMIGGGGAGSYNTGGGGGSGAAIIAINQTIPSGSYNITVGAGGTINSTSGANGGNGGDTSIGSLYVAKGGGGGGWGSGSPSVTGNVGGSSGGAGGIQGNPAGGLISQNPSSANVVGGTTGISPGITSTYAVLGNKGGNSVAWSSAYDYNQVNGGGGGGIGVAGGNGTNSSCGVGGDGVYQVTIADITYNLKNYFSPTTTFGVNDGSGNFYIGGGGGGGGYQSSASTVNGGKGGGGNGRDAPGGGTSGSGATNTGSGGGGGEGNNNTPGGGGSGLVIIRFKNYLSIMAPTSGGSGGGGAKSQTGAVAGTKFDDYKSLALAGLSGNTTTGGNGGSGSSLYNTRYTTTITGSSLSVGLGGSGMGTSPTTPVTKTNYGDGGDGNGGVGYQGIVIIRFKADDSYLHVKAIKDNGNCGLILNANEVVSGTTTPYQLRIHPWSDTYTTTGITTRGWSFRCHDSGANLDLINLFSYFGGRVGIKTRNPAAVFDVNGDIKCKSFIIEGTEQYGIVCQVVNQHATGDSSINVFAGQGVNYGGLSVVYLPSSTLGYLSCSKNLKIKTGNDAANSYIYIDNSTGNVGIGLQNPSSKLEVSGTTTTNFLSAGIIYTGELQTNIINNYDGNIVNNKNLFSSNIYVNNFIDCQNKPIYNCSILYGTADIAKEWRAITNYYHRDDQGRDRIYFKNDTGAIPNHFTLFKSGGTTHTFADKDDVQYCLLERFGITTYFEVVSGGAYDNVGVADGVTSGTYVFRKMILRLSTFTEVHRCFCEDEIYTNYDDFINEFVGRIVVSKGTIKTALKKEGEDWKIFEGKDGVTIDDSHPVIELSRKKKDKKVIGVITKRNQNDDIPNRLVINSLGEGAVWVINTNGNFEAGDFIQTSDEIGYGERQDDDVNHNYSLGKVMIDCNFELDNPNYKCEVIDEVRDLRRAFIPCFYYSG